MTQDQAMEVLKMGSNVFLTGPAGSGLYTHNADVDAINEMELSKINQKVHSYKMTGRGNKDLLDFLHKSCLAPEDLNIKVGAVVMFVKNNYEKGYVNGTLGKVIGFDENDYPMVETTGGREIIAAPTSAFGLGYVALSRVRTLAGMKLVGINDMALRVNPEVLEMDKYFKSDLY